MAIDRELVATVGRQHESASLKGDHANRIRASVLATVLLPFAFGYFMSYFFRTVNALLAGRLTADIGVTAAELGLLTSTYFFAAAIAQLPVGFALDWFGPRRMQIAALAVAATGAAGFALADDFFTLCIARALIGLGVASALAAGVKVIALRFPAERAGLLNGILVAAGALGAIAASAPTEWLLTLGTWRDLYLGLAIVTAIIWLAHVLIVPRDLPVPVLQHAPQGFGSILRDARFWRFAPMASLVIGTAWAYQGLWMAVRFSHAANLALSDVVQLLLIMAVSFCIGAFAYGVVLDRLQRVGIGPAPMMASVAFLIVLVELAMALRAPISPTTLAILIGLVSASTVLSYTTLRVLFDTGRVGRANGLLNTMNFAIAFAVQSGFGWMIGRVGVDATGSIPVHAFASAFLVFAAAKLLALVWFLSGSITKAAATPTGRNWRIAGVGAAAPLLALCLLRLSMPERTEMATFPISSPAVAAVTTPHTHVMAEAIRTLEHNLQAALGRETTLTGMIAAQHADIITFNQRIASLTDQVSRLEHKVADQTQEYVRLASPAPTIVAAAAAPAASALQPAACHTDQLDANGTVVIPFDSKQATLDDDDLRRLEPLLALARICKTARLFIEGFTDNRGTHASNADLSRRRADRVATYIAARGIAPGVVSSEARGAIDPIATGDTRAARARNRRVEVTIRSAP